MNNGLQSLILEGTQQLSNAGIENPKFESELLLSFALDKPREEIFLNLNAMASKDEINAFREAINRRAQREPVAYIIGCKEFWSLSFRVTPDTLIPRPDTERLVEIALKEVSHRNKEAINILDLGTGSGCILISLLSELPNAIGIGVDVSTKALAVAKENGQKILGGERVQFLEWDWWKPIPRELKDRRFDLILSNPPYIAECEEPTLSADVINFEPRGALMAGPDGLNDYRQLSACVRELLSADGLFMMEIGIDQGASVREILLNQGWQNINVLQDYTGRDRVICAR